MKDWVGRCIAESRTAKGSHAVTLTYGRDATYGSADHVRAAVLTYSDVQTWLKLLRKKHGRVRYFITGEWGGLKGRTHWHVMLFWYDAKRMLQDDDLQLDTQCVVQGLWDDRHFRAENAADRGFSFWTKPNYKQVWYNCKYILKGQGELEQTVLPRMSKLPPLGYWYFAGVAREYARQGLAPQSLDYTFPDIRKGVGQDGEFHSFRLAGRSAELFLDAYLRAWREVQGDSPRPASVLVDDFEEWGRVVNPDTFHYRPEAPGVPLREDRRGPVTPEEVRHALARVRRRDDHDWSIPFNVLVERAGWEWRKEQAESGPVALPEARRPHLTR